MADLQKQAETLGEALQTLAYWGQNPNFREDIKKQLTEKRARFGTIQVPIKGGGTRSLATHMFTLMGYSKTYSRFYDMLVVERLSSAELIDQFMMSCWVQGRGEYNRLMDLKKNLYAPYYSDDELRKLAELETLPPTQYKDEQLLSFLNNIRSSKPAIGPDPSTSGPSSNTPPTPTTPPVTPPTIPPPVPPTPPTIPIQPITPPVTPPPPTLSTTPAINPPPVTATPVPHPSPTPPMPSPVSPPVLIQSTPIPPPVVVTPSIHIPTSAPVSTPRPITRSEPRMTARLGGRMAQQTAGKVGGAIANKGLGLIAKAALGASNPVGWVVVGASLLKPKTLKKVGLWVLWIVLGLGLLIFSIDTNNQTAPLVTGLQNYSANAGSTGNGGGGDISACTFYRGQLTPPGVQYKSQKLISYFQEASTKSGVPASVLAAIARVESPGAASLTDQGLDAWQCPISPTGALGLMQIQPSPAINPDDPGAYYLPGVELGASFLGTSADQLTRDDFCDPRKSIYLAAGFVIKKTRDLMKLSGSTWDPSWTNNREVINTVASGYYGCLKYPSCNSGPYSYGDDVWNSVSQCQSSTSVAGGTITPVGEGADRLASTAVQIAGQLLNNQTDQEKLLANNIICDGANGRPLPEGDYNGYHCWRESTVNKYDLAQDPYYLQCTEFITAVFDKAGFLKQISLINSPGNANNWPSNAKNHPEIFDLFQDATKLQKGDIISLGVNHLFGHVVIVISRDGNTLKVAQSATSAQLETWYIDLQTGKLHPAYEDLPTRNTVSGYIRLKDYTRS